MLNARQRYVFVATVSLIFLLITIFLIRERSVGRPRAIIEHVQDLVTPPPKPTGPVYKPDIASKAPPIVDNFPLAAAAHSAADLPPIPRWNKPPTPHVKERTPLFIGFTRNWRLLQQVVVSYITAGWPPEDIYVVENTGVMDANKLGQLSLQNPFFLNHTRLEMLGVNVIIAPTLLTFAQLQNFYIYTSTVEKYDYYFWSHMDLVLVSYEDRYANEHPGVDLANPDLTFSDFKSIYDYCLEALREVLTTTEADGKPLRWAMRFFSYDRLALVNVKTFKEVGGWDTQIPFYMTDCDMHARLLMAGLTIEDKPSGLVFDVASSLDDLIVLYRKTKTPAGKAVEDPKWIDPNIMLDDLEAVKDAELLLDKAGMNSERGLAGREDEREGRVKDKDKDKDKGKEAFDAAAAFDAGFVLPPGVTPPAPAAGWQEDAPGGEGFFKLKAVLDTMQGSKGSSARGRNTWQGRQTGGKGYVHPLLSPSKFFSYSPFFLYHFLSLR
jgi:hypothetical protein